MTKPRNVILGGGVAAGYLAQEYVDIGGEPGCLTIVSAESLPPYERPPLSKEFQESDQPASTLLINPEEFYRDNEIRLALNTWVEQVDLQAQQLYCAGNTIGYDNLVIATGARPRTFEMVQNVTGVGRVDICYLRTAEDARRIRSRAREAGDAVVIGGSFIGMEMASSLSQLGVQTTLLFPESRVWEALFTPEMSAFFQDYYRQQGVTVRPDSQISGFDRLDDGRTVIRLEDGAEYAADLVVAGIGVEPRTGLFAGTGLHIRDGILVNRFLETNMPHVYAAGDVARYRDGSSGAVRRVEHWDNAVHQGRHLAHALLGERHQYRHIPYFFSDVFDLSYEFWGDAQDADRVVHRGAMDEGSFSTWWLQDDQVVAAFVMNRPDEERKVAQEWIDQAAEVSAQVLVDPAETLQVAAA